MQRMKLVQKTVHALNNTDQNMKENRLNEEKQVNGFQERKISNRPSFKISNSRDTDWKYLKTVDT